MNIIVWIFLEVESSEISVVNAKCTICNQCNPHPHNILQMSRCLQLLLFLGSIMQTHAFITCKNSALIKLLFSAAERASNTYNQDSFMLLQKNLQSCMCNNSTIEEAFEDIENERILRIHLKHHNWKTPTLKHWNT